MKAIHGKIKIVILETDEMEKKRKPK